MPEPREPRALCPACRRPVSVCWCAHVRPLTTRTRVLILQHPRERRVPVGTAPIVRACLPDSRILVGVEFAGRPEFEAALADLEHPPALLFPGPQARDLATDPPCSPLTLIVVDGTWSQAKQLLARNPRLRALPRYSLAPSRPSTYRIRQAPSPQCLSTLEALAAALGAIEGEPSRFEALLAPFTALVERQLAHAGAGQGLPSRHRHRWAGSDKPPRIPSVFLHGTRDLVCLSAEANAWNQRRAGAAPDELVHAVALRLETGESFESLVAPRAGLSPSTALHARLPPERIAAGVPVTEFRQRWRGFLRETDVLVAWGPYPFELLRAEDCWTGNAQIDLRKVVGDVWKRPPGSLDRLLRDEIGEEPPPLGEGRAGARLGQLAAATRWFIQRAAASERASEDFLPMVAATS